MRVFSIDQRAVTDAECRSLCPTSNDSYEMMKDHVRALRNADACSPLSLGAALAVMTLAQAQLKHVELQALNRWLLALSNGALIILASHLGNWRFSGPESEKTEFFAGLWQSDRSLRYAYAQRRLGLHNSRAVAELRYYSGSRIVCPALGDTSLDANEDPLLAIEARWLATSLRNGLNGDLFFAR
jgi:hypothetical protein